MKKGRINWLDKLMLKFWPKMAMKKIAGKIEIKNPIFDKLHNVLSQSKRIDIFPYESGTRGFIITIDQETSLYFNQDEDHFVYDGFEMGEYDKGDVTIFDNLKK